MPATARRARPLHRRNAAATRERVLSIAETAFAARGFEGASLDDIATEAGVRKATLFYYFRSKDVLYASVAARVAARFAPLVAILSAEPSVATLEQLVGRLHDLLEASRQSAVLLMREALDWGDGRTGRSTEASSAVTPLLDAAGRWVRAGQRLGRFSDALPARAAVASIVGAVAMPFLNPRLFRPDRGGAITFVERALAARAPHRRSR